MAGDLDALSGIYKDLSGSPVDYSSLFEGIAPEESFNPLELAEMANKPSIAATMQVTPDRAGGIPYSSHSAYMRAGGELDYDMWNQALEMTDWKSRAPKTIAELLKKLGQLQQPVNVKGHR